MKCLSPIVATIIAFFFVNVTSTQAQTLKIVHFCIGYGDATLICSPSGQNILIDAGENEPVVVDTIVTYLQSQGITNLNYTLATHYHSDHFGGFISLFEDYNYVPTIAFDRGHPGMESEPGYEEYIQLVENVYNVRASVSAGQIIDLGSGVTVTVVLVKGYYLDGQYTYIRSGDQFENARCICLLVEFNDFRYVVAGDLWGYAIDLETHASELIGDIDVFQMNHHGGESSTNQNWLDNLNAEASIVSSNNALSPIVISRIDGSSLHTLYHTTGPLTQATISEVCSSNVFLETDGLTYYNIAGDHYNLGINVALAPINPPIVIPEVGGSFEYRLALSNSGSTPVAFDFWIMMQLPDNTWCGPMLGPVNLTMPTGASAVRLREHSIPHHAPSGTYLYEGRAGIYPNDVWSDDSFTFEKLAEDDLLSHDFGWALLGLEENEVIPEAAPTEYALCPAHPNPFNPTTTISYQLSTISNVNLAVYDIGGRMVAQLVDGVREAGRHEVIFDASNLSSGVYFSRIIADDFQQTQKLLLVK